MNGMSDEDYMARAVYLARKGVLTTDPNPNVGCVLVKHGKIIGEGWHQEPGKAHAEINALRQSGDTKGATAYVTLEPCSHHGKTGPCCDALIAAGISKVVIAMQDPNPLVCGQGIEKLRQQGVEVSCGVLQEDAEALNQGFLQRMRKGLPFIRSKMAMSLDGRTAMASGESQWITSPQSREDVHHFRATSSAVMTGINTVLADDPRLTARVETKLQQPVRVILDTHLRIPLHAKVLHDEHPVWIMTGQHNRSKTEPLTDKGAKVFTLPCVNNRIDLTQAFRLLATQQINTVWVEAGATLNGALIESGLVDEWVLYVAPCLLGNNARSLVELPALHQLADKVPLKMLSCRHVGPDLRLIYQQINSDVI